MKNIKFTYFKYTFILVCTMALVLSCERELSDDTSFATFPTTAEIFIDAPVGLTDQFFRSFDPAEGANTSGFGVDNNTVYKGTTSIRIDVPASNDPEGNFIGGVFEDRGAGRNLTGSNRRCSSGRPRGRTGSRRRRPPPPSQSEPQSDSQSETPGSTERRACCAR